MMSDKKSRFTKQNVLISPNDFQTLAIYAFRYAFGRKTYAVDEMINFLKSYKDDLDGNSVHVICRDIEREAGKFEDLNSYFSHDDLMQWLNLSKVLRNRS